MTDTSPHHQPQPPQPPAGWPPPAPPVKSKRGRLVAALTIGAVALCCSGVAIAAMAGGGDDKPASSGTTTGAAPVDKAAEVPTKAATTKAAPPAPAKPRVLLTVKGSGIKNTAKFTTDDEWQLKYSFDCSNFGYSGNFQIYDYVGGDLGDVLTNELAKKGADTVPVYSAGKHYLKVNTQCRWTITVIG